jgi:hypothetical protein
MSAKPTSPTPLEAALARYNADVPLSAGDVALIRGISVAGVVQAAARGKLRRSGGGRAPFRRADVEAWCVGEGPAQRFPAPDAPTLPEKKDGA